MEQRLRLRIFLGSGVKCVKNKLIVVAVTYCVGDNTFIFEVEHRAEVHLATTPILELRNIHEPLLVKSDSREFAVKDISRCNVRR